MRPFLALGFSLIILTISCKPKKSSDVALFELMQNTGVDFNNTVIDGRLENSFLFRNFYNGGGVAVGDINNDGLPDLFFTGNSVSNKLYLNKGNFQFDDITKSAGIIFDDQWSTGVVFADVNSDGWLDIYVCSSGHMGTGTRKNKLYINDRNLHFTEAAKQYGLDISAYATQTSFFDYDLDGDLDCFLINNSPIPINQLNYANRRDLPDSAWKIADFLKGGGDHLYRNDNGFFKEVTREAGIHGGLISFGLGVSVSDINNDGYPDVFVSNDSYERDYLYINQKNGTFKDELEEWFQHTSFSSMGADIADINNDGYQDLFTTDMLPLNDYRLKTTGSFDRIDLYNSKIKAGFYYQYTKNCLQLNNKNGKFIDIARYSGVAATDWSWGALMFDMDNDGLNDLLVCNGVNHDVTNLDFMDFFANDVIQKMVLTGKKDQVDKVLKEIPVTPLPNQVYRNSGNLAFENVSKKWGLDQPSFSNGAAYGDLDNDGDLDLIVSNQNGPSFIYKNKSREHNNNNNYLTIELEGTGKNPFAIGSKVELFTNGEVLTRELFPSRGFQSSVDYKLVFGLGRRNKIDSIRITWPNTAVQVAKNISINQKIKFRQDSTSTKPPVRAIEKIATIFSAVNSEFQKHTENDHYDFYAERNIPVMLSREGPKAAIADVNGDGLEDIYIGGTTKKQGQLYLQRAGGKFVPSPQKSFELFKDFEDVAIVFLDFDKDGDNDLLIGPGGNDNYPMSRPLQLRLFKNDGRGNFSIDASVFPNTGMNISVLAVHDFNNDGFPDVFAGGRSYPQIYGQDAESYIFLNDTKGHFKETAAEKNPEIFHIGMVTGAVWANVSGDDKKELIITGEWMAPRIFSFNGDRFAEIKTNISDMFGWWQTVSVADVNGDGLQDLILGNVGENFVLKPSKEYPVKLWMNDYDQNNSIDKIITYNFDGRDMPVFLKRDMEEQLPILKKQNLKHQDFANKTIQQLFSPEMINKSIVKTFNYSSSCIALNQGNGKFAIKKLPLPMQMSSVNAIHCTDVNNDGHPDIITGGNQFGFIPQLERLDASFGEVLINDGKGNFSWQENKKTGLNVRGEVRDINEFTINKNKYLLFLQNNDFPLMYKMNSVK